MLRKTPKDTIVVGVKLVYVYPFSLVSGVIGKSVPSADINR